MQKFTTGRVQFAPRSGVVQKERGRRPPALQFSFPLSCNREQRWGANVVCSNDHHQFLWAWEGSLRDSPPPFIRMRFISCLLFLFVYAAKEKKHGVIKPFRGSVQSIFKKDLFFFTFCQRASKGFPARPCHDLGFHAWKIGLETLKSG